MDLDSATIAGVGDMIATNGESSVVRDSLFGSLIDADVAICNIFALLEWDIILSSENNCVGAIACTWDALGKATKFGCVGLAPQFLVLGVDEKVAHFHVHASVIVEDSIENFLWVSSA